jgi:hypothetical protein
MAALSKAWFCARLFAGIAGLEPAGGMDICILRVLSGRDPCDWPISRPEESYRVSGV